MLKITLAQGRGLAKVQLGCVLLSFPGGVSSGLVQDPERQQESNAVRNTVLALVIAAMATPVYAQVGPNLSAGSVKLKTDVEVKQEQEREAGYKAGISKIPDQKAKSDPWGGVRSVTPPSGQNQSRANAK